MNRQLPVLKLLLFPVVGAVAYGAFCYYTEEYQNKISQLNAPIRYLQKLSDLVQQTQNSKELVRLYKLITKHMDENVVDPSLKQQKLDDYKVVRDVQEGMTISSKQKIQKDYTINLFNSRTQKKEGVFCLGIWTQFNEVQLNSLHIVDKMLKLSDKSVKLRQKKCRSIAEKVSINLERGYLEEYIECMGITADSAAQLQRQNEVIKKILKYQLI